MKVVFYNKNGRYAVIQVSPAIRAAIRKMGTMFTFIWDPTMSKTGYTLSSVITVKSLDTWQEQSTARTKIKTLFVSTVLGAILLRTVTAEGKRRLRRSNATTVQKAETHLTKLLQAPIKPLIHFVLST